MSVSIEKTIVDFTIMDSFHGHQHFDFIIYDQYHGFCYTNYDACLSKINELVHETLTTREKRTLVYLREPRLYIESEINQNNQLVFRISGKDLPMFHQCLPKIFSYRKNEYVNPRVDKDHSRIYPGYSINEMICLAARLMMVELHLRDKVISYEKIKTNKGVLGVHVDVVVPNDLKGLGLSKSKFNPFKVDDGKFYYKKNGIELYKIYQTCLYLSIIERYRLLFKKTIYGSDCDTWKEFIQSTSIVAINQWNEHSRVIIKCDNDLYMIDPWINNSNYYNESKTYCEIVEICKKENKIFQFIPRDIKDQMTGEGSCAIAATARALYLADQLRYGFNKERVLMLIERPIPDIHALVANKILGTIKIDL